MSDLVLVETKEHICTVTLNRPEKRNALNPELLRQLKDTFGGIKTGGEVRVVVLRGMGEKAFCAGADLTAVLSEEGGGDIVQDALESVANCPCPVIAMIYRYAVGAGCDLAAACDFRIIADSARIGINPVKIGLVYSQKAIARFVSLVGSAYTKELFLTGRFVTAQRALEMGLVNSVVPEDELLSATYSLAQELAENGPLAVSGTKFIINKYSNRQLNPEDDAEVRTLVKHARQTEDMKEGAQAFAEKRKPEFHGK